MKLIKVGFIKILIFAIFQSCGSSSIAYKIKDIPVDYNPQEVVNDYYDDDGKLGYTVLKDENYLYVNLHATEKSSQLKILQNGVRLFFDKEGDKKKASYIQTPASSLPQTKNEIKKSAQDITAFLEHKILELENDILLVKDDIQESINARLNDKGISIELKIVESELFFQIKFPINYLAVNNEKLPSLGIFIKGIKSMKSPQQPQVKMSGGKGGGGRGGRGGGRGGNNSSTQKSSSTPQKQGFDNDIEIWLNLDLSE